MSGSSEHTPRSPAAAQIDGGFDLAGFLRTRVRVIAGSIGERNLLKYGALKRARDFIEKELRAAGLAPERQSFHVGPLKVDNIETAIHGARLPEKILVVGAHYDTVFGCPGANDNGTGVVATLALAKVLAGLSPACTVRLVFFVNEEPPFFHGEMMGSVVYARRCRERREKIIGMISLETLGYYSDEPGSQEFPDDELAAKYPDQGNFVCFAGDAHSGPFVRKVHQAFVRHSDFPAEPLIASENEVPAVGYSDHWGFQQVGYPALMATDTAMFRYPHYHQKTDTPDKVDYDDLAIVVRGIAAAVQELAGASEPIS
ncbi:MAG: M28 family peptidase [Candidatus Sericytochromatia bacterium]|nr:M28 family peptidase [Candidatus Tanganyikabacteria bacterium]